MSERFAPVLRKSRRKDKGKWAGVYRPNNRVALILCFVISRARIFGRLGNLFADMNILLVRNRRCISKQGSQILDFGRCASREMRNNRCNTHSQWRILCSSFVVQNRKKRNKMRQDGSNATN